MYTLSSNLHPINKKKIYKGEETCKHVLDKLLPGYNFIRCRPDFLKNPETGKNLELDFYCDKLKLAVEFNGQQHYQYTEYYHKHDHYNFYQQQQRDQSKRDLCMKNNIKLIIVKYDQNVEQFLTNELIKFGFLSSPSLLTFNSSQQTGCIII